jgi:hypothetical protein
VRTKERRDRDACREAQERHDDDPTDTDLPSPQEGSLTQAPARGLVVPRFMLPRHQRRTIAPIA